MKCLNDQQISDYLHGYKSEENELHLADCGNCRKNLLKFLSQSNPSSNITSSLKKETIKAIRYAIKTEQKSQSRPQLIFHFNTRIKFAMAAGLLVAATYGAVMHKAIIQHYFNHALQVLHATSSISRQAVKENDTAIVKSSVLQSTKVGATNCPAITGYDTMKNPTAHGRPHKEKESIIRLGKASGIFAEPKTSITVMIQTDTNASIEMSQGNALFSIEPKRYRSFVVKTPTAVITVTGTVFSLFVDNKYTMVNVAEGSVRLSHQFKPQIETVERGNGAVVDKDSIISMMLENSPIFKEREHLLQEYIQQAIIGTTAHDTATKQAVSNKAE